MNTSQTILLYYGANHEISFFQNPMPDNFSNDDPFFFIEVAP
jgi:hypothetical protein